MFELEDGLNAVVLGADPLGLRMEGLGVRMGGQPIPGWQRAAAALLAMALCVGCPAVIHQSIRIDPGDGLEFRIDGVDGCDDFANPAINLDHTKALVLLVHGCKASSGRFRHLAEVFEAHGQPTLCFNYHYRRRIASSAEGLASSIKALTDGLPHSEVRVIGHSQGGLVARRALVSEGWQEGEVQDQLKLRLVTVSSPFNGIHSSSHCGIAAFHILSLGLTTAICQGIAGSIWPEVHPRSRFVTEPSDLLDIVSDHLIVVTDERGSCRKWSADDRCLVDDFVFSVAEQRNERLIEDRRVTDLKVRSGHAAIVGDEDRPPLQLIAILQEHAIMNRTPPDREAEVQLLLSRLY
jgi:pimeloyl-ACP methyl ester carboxylesterase